MSIPVVCNNDIYCGQKWVYVMQQTVKWEWEEPLKLLLPPMLPQATN